MKLDITYSYNDPTSNNNVLKSKMSIETHEINKLIDLFEFLPYIISIDVKDFKLDMYNAPLYTKVFQYIGDMFENRLKARTEHFENRIKNALAHENNIPPST